MTVGNQMGQNIFEVLLFSVVLFCGLGAMILIHPTTMLASLVVFLLGCAVPIVGRLVLNALFDKRKEKK